MASDEAFAGVEGSQSFVADIGDFSLSALLGGVAIAAKNEDYGAAGMVERPKSGAGEVEEATLMFLECLVTAVFLGLVGGEAGLAEVEAVLDAEEEKDGMVFHWFLLLLWGSRSNSSFIAVLWKGVGSTQIDWFMRLSSSMRGG